MKEWYSQQDQDERWLRQQLEEEEQQALAEEQRKILVNALHRMIEGLKNE